MGIQNRKVRKGIREDKVRYKYVGVVVSADEGMKEEGIHRCCESREVWEVGESSERRGCLGK